MKVIYILLLSVLVIFLTALTLYNISDAASSVYVWPYFVLIPVIFGLRKLGRAIKDSRERRLLDNSWNSPANLPIGIELNNIKSAYETAKKSRKLCPAAEIDDGSWNDFNMDQVYHNLNYCISAPGFYFLYESLRNPLTGKEKLEKRARQISFFENESVKSFRGSCENIGRALLPLHTVEHLNILKLVYRENDSGRLFSACRVMRIMAFAAIAGFFILNLTAALLFFLSVFIINLILSSILKQKTRGEVPALTGLLRLIKAAGKIKDVDLPESFFNDLTDEIKEKSSILNKVKGPCRFLYQKTAALDNPVDILWMYLDIFFLIEAIAYYKSLSFIQSNKKNVIDLFCLIGEIDFLCSLAAFREATASYKKICRPEFSGINAIICKEAYHPLVVSAVKNDISIESPGLLLTGANMAGKSTFLRTIGINSILAQSILTVFADHWEADIFIVKSSIEKHDSLISGKSFYFAEAQRVGDILNFASSSDLPVLCLFDELLSGTNTEEREAAVTSILRGAASMNTLCLAATHDRKVVDEFSGSFMLRHFSYYFDQSGLVFDYKLKDGRVKNGNAIELLKYLGYPEKIVDDAFQLIN